MIYEIGRKKIHEKVQKKNTRKSSEKKIQTAEGHNSNQSISFLKTFSLALFKKKSARIICFFFIKYGQHRKQGHNSNQSISFLKTFSRSTQIQINLFYS